MVVRATLQAAQDTSTGMQHTLTLYTVTFSESAQPTALRAGTPGSQYKGAPSLAHDGLADTTQRFRVQGLKALTCTVVLNAIKRNEVE